MAGGIEIRPAHFPGRAPIDAYGNGGFRFAEMSHRGSLLCVPSGIHGWHVEDASQLTVSDFSSIIEQASDIEFLLIGMGDTMRVVPKELRLALKEAGIAVDAMSTGAAVRTYNIMLSESRSVAAALIAVEG
ncbi:Mth938-like domain-containing protein [Agrobacterium sp. rho-13.3]|jgi:uncharacterized protein|uniref:Mth938-like domain-containing protein n=1 Tax=Agrobacterium sp. rho-13.3 TaxID=3072980 RepID=UPI002A17D333|nr:Mth938-like domain-containing protein [Agrobacterium sp. rho-13.3]MDX8309415.1 Mth938-like domain-containing protein [Agrobacterium sp. rho-13.3]